MNRLEKSLAGLLLSAGLAVGVNPLTAAPQVSSQAFDEGSGFRSLIDRTQSDLRDASDIEHKDNKEKDRYKNAQRNLSDLDRHLTKGHFDKGKLDRSIGDIQSILDHNTLQASSRDALLRDIADLRIARERRGR
jgi:hypothetical protein